MERNTLPKFISQLEDHYLSLLFFCPCLFSPLSLKWNLPFISDFSGKNRNFVYLHVFLFSVYLALLILFISQATRGVSVFKTSTTIDNAVLIIGKCHTVVNHSEVLIIRHHQIKLINNESQFKSSTKTVNYIFTYKQNL